MTRNQMTNWNKGTKVGTRAVGATAGAIATGGVGAAATGYGIGALTDPLVDAILPTFTNTQMVKHNISTGTIADNYQYGKTDDAYSLTSSQSKDPMEKFNKGLNYADTAVSLIGGVVGGVQSAGKLTGGELGGELATKVGTDALATSSDELAMTASGELSKNSINTLFNKIPTDEVKKNIKNSIFENISDWAYKNKQKSIQDEKDLWDEQVDNDMQDEFITPTDNNYKVPTLDEIYPNQEIGTKWKPFSNLTEYFKRKRNVPSYINPN